MLSRMKSRWARRPFTHSRVACVMVPVILLTLRSSPTVLAHPGKLDSSFGRDGKVTTGFTARKDLGNAIAVQTDGRIVVVGRASGAGGRFAVARYNRDGTLDPTFSGNGKVMTNFTARGDFAEGVAIQDDGRIVVVGRAGRYGGRFALARYKGNGTLDPSFGGNGKVMTNFTTGGDLALSVAIQTDGKIIAAGAGGRPLHPILLARYNTDGTLDPTFSDNGKVQTNLGGASQWAADVAIQTNGKIVVAGTFVGLVGVFVLVRYFVDGSIDTSFGRQGRVFTDFKGDNGATGLAIQANGRIVAGGWTAFFTVGEPGSPMFAIARYKPDGTLDPAFGGNGKVITNFTAGADVAEGIAIEPDGKLVAAGWAGGGARFALARYRLNGELDHDFGGNGTVMTDFTPKKDIASAVAVMPNGKILAAGSAGNRVGFALARYRWS